MKKSFNDLYLSDSSMIKLTSSIEISEIDNFINALSILIYLLRSQIERERSFRVIGSINRLFSARNDISNITSCDIKNVILKIEDFLIYDSSMNLIFTMICLKI